MNHLNDTKKAAVLWCLQGFERKGIQCSLEGRAWAWGPNLSVPESWLSPYSPAVWPV